MLADAMFNYPHGREMENLEIITAALESERMSVYKHPVTFSPNIMLEVILQLLQNGQTLYVSIGGT